MHEYNADFTWLSENEWINEWMDEWINGRLSAKGCVAFKKKLIVGTIYSSGYNEDITMQ